MTNSTAPEQTRVAAAPGWPSTVSAVLYSLMVAATAALVMMGMGAGITEVSSSTEGARLVLPSVGEFVLSMVTLLLPTVVFWVPGMVLAGISRLWTPMEKALVMSTPLLVLLITALTWVLTALVSAPPLVSMLVFFLGYGALLAMLIRLASRAQRRVGGPVS